ncbi:MAG TPA: VWA domain-containing protein [Thermoanaerobaculia bacterium]|nr:VWA domain-containing protein [Thermoanaerobaculia bacterium]
MALIAGAAVAEQAAGPRLTEVTQVTAVEVPVHVVRDGLPVRGLKAADFEVYLGKQQLAIAGFDVLDVAAPAAAGAELTTGSAALRRHFLLLFDLSFSEPRSLLRARQAVRDTVLPRLAPSDLVAVATYSSARGPQLVLAFSPDRKQLATAVESLGLPQLVDRSADPLKLVAGDLTFKSEAEPDTPVTGGNPVASGKRGGLQFLLTMLKEIQQEQTRISDQAARDVLGNVVTSYARAMTDLAKLMGDVHGRKEVVLLSEGFDSAVLQGSESQREQASRTDAVAFGEYQNISSDQRFGNTKQNNEMESMLEEFRRADCTIQAIDIGGVRAGGVGADNDLAGNMRPAADNDRPGGARASGEATLFQMAHDTGGELYRNMNDLGDAMGRLLDKTAVTYVLSVQPEDIKRDGAYHRLRVELKNAPRGTQVIARAGFYAPRPYKRQSPRERMVSAANELMGGSSSGSVRIAVLAAALRPEGAKAYVPVVIEADGASLLAGSEGTATLPAEIYVYALDREGTIQDYFAQSLSIDLAKAPPQLHQVGLKFFGHLELGAGNYVLRVLVRNGATRAYGLRVERLAVPDLAAGGPALLPPLFRESLSRWLLVRETQRGAATEAQYPFMAGQQQFIPASRPELTAGQPSPVSLLGFGLAAGEVKVAARILSEDGRDLGAGELKMGELEEGELGGPVQLLGTFRPPAQLPPGDYQLVVTLTAAQGAPLHSAIQFVVRGARAAHG